MCGSVSTTKIRNRQPDSAHKGNIISQAPAISSGHFLGPVFLRTVTLFGKAFHKGNIRDKVFVTTDGFSPYGWVLKHILKSAFLYGQVVKKWKKNRVTKVERKYMIDSKQQIEDALACSEDSGKLNTSFIERLNLAIRRNDSYLHRKTPAHARYGNRLRGQLEFQRCYYDFMRPHMALRFGNETYTPAMMAEIADRKLSWRDILENKLIKLFAFLFAVPENDQVRLKIAA